MVMEATGDYWKPFYYLLEDAGFEVMLVNARHVKNLPGRKTDVSDATWLAQLGAHGLVRGSFVPPEPIRQLRDLTRARTAITRERGREVQRLEKLLEDAGIKLSAVATDIIGVSGRAMLEALIAGQHDPAVLADLAKRRLRSKIPALTEALTGRFTDHHAFLARVHLDLIDRHTDGDRGAHRPDRGGDRALSGLPRPDLHHPRDRSHHRRRDHRRDRRRHDPVPHRRAPGLLGRDLPGQQRVRRPGEVDQDPARQPLPQGALGAAAMSCAQHPDTYLGARYRRIASRRGPQKANVAIQHAMLTAIWHMGTTGDLYDDPGADYFTRLHPERAKKRAVDQLEAMGYRVTLDPTG